MTPGMLTRLLVAAAAVAAMIGAGLSGSPAVADDQPTVCGYVEVGNDGTTTTEPLVTSCDESTCEGPSVGPAPGGVLGISWDVFACVDDL